MAEGELIVGLDIGTSKIGVIIGETDGEGGFKVIGVGTSPSEGLRHGAVVNMEKAIGAIVKAVEEAEMMAGVRVDSVYVGISGDHVKSINTRGMVAISGPNNQVTKEDVRRVIKAARAVSLPPNQEILHVLPQEFIIDDQIGIKDPLGISGVRLEVKVHIVTAAATALQNIRRCVNEAGLRVKKIVLEPLASSLAVLGEDEKELGVGLLDLGGGTTDIALFFEGSIQHTGVIELGGDNVTKDIAKVLRTPVNQAEKIKIKHGCAIGAKATEEETIEVAGIDGRPSRTVPRSFLTRIIQARMEEIFKIAQKEIKRSAYADFLATGIVITGGGALLKGAVELAERIFDMPVTLGVPKGFGGLVDLAQNPIHATGVGLVLYGLKHEAEEQGVKMGIIEKLKRWLKEFG